MNCGHGPHVYKAAFKCGPKGHYDFYGPMMHKAFGHLKHFMPYDLEETETSYIVEMPLPGFDVEDIEVSVRGNQIQIDAKYEDEVEPESTEKTEDDEKKHPKHEECFPFPMRMGKFFWKRPIHVTINVDDPIVPDNVKARLKKGILHIEFTKEPKQKVKVDVES